MSDKIISPKDKISPIPLVCGAVLAVISLFVRLASANPYEVIHMTNSSDIFPPIWVFNLFGILFSFVSGLALGLIAERVIGNSIGAEGKARAFFGGMAYVGLFFLSILWYPLFFSGKFMLLSLFIALLSVLLSVICAIIWMRLNIFAMLLMSANAIWLFYVFFLNSFVILHN